MSQVQPITKVEAITEENLDYIGRSISNSMLVLMKNAVTVAANATKLFNILPEHHVTTWDIRTYSATPEGQATPETRSLEAVLHPWIERTRTDVMDSNGTIRIVELAFLAPEKWNKHRRLNLRLEILTGGALTHLPPQRVRSMEMDVYFNGVETETDADLEALIFLVPVIEGFFQYQSSPDLSKMSPRFSVVLGGKYDMLDDKIKPDIN